MRFHIDIESHPVGIDCVEHGDGGGRYPTVVQVLHNRTEVGVLFCGIEMPNGRRNKEDDSYTGYASAYVFTLPRAKALAKALAKAIEDVEGS